MGQLGGGRVRSEDGRWEWDGQAWQPVDPSTQLPAPSMGPPPGYPGFASPPAVQQGGGRAIASFILGLLDLLFWLLPILGIPIGIVGLVLGITSRDSPRRGLAVAGIVMSIIGLVLGLGNALIGAYLGATGRLRFFG